MSISVPTLKPGKNHGKGSLKAIQVLLNINVHLCPPLSARTSPHDYLRDGGTRAFSLFAQSLPKKIPTPFRLVVR